MADLSQVTLAPVPWCHSAGADVVAIDGFESADIAHFKAGVADGTYHLLAIRLGGVRVGTLLWEADHIEGDRTAVIHVISAKSRHGIDLITRCYEIFKAEMDAGKFDRMRCFTERAGMAEKLTRLGWTKRIMLELT